MYYGRVRGTRKSDPTRRRVEFPILDLTTRSSQSSIVVFVAVNLLIV